MSRTSKLLIGIVALLSLLLFALWQPSGGDKSDSFLWNRSFERIEFYPEGRSEFSEGVEPLLLFERRRGWMSDEADVTIRGLGRTLGGSMARNIFLDWSRPLLQASFRPEDVAGVAAAQIDDDSPLLRLYISVRGQPVEVVLGGQQQSHAFIGITGEERLHLVSKNIVEQFFAPPHSFRDHRLAPLTTPDAFYYRIDIGELRLERDQPRQWRIDGEIVSDRQQIERLNRLHSDLDRLRGESFLDDPQLDAGIVVNLPDIEQSVPELRVILFESSGARITLELWPHADGHGGVVRSSRLAVPVWLGEVQWQQLLERIALEGGES